MADLTPQEPHAETQEQAKLRIYIGAAPGVGKTYQMLEEANQMRRNGVDVVIGLVEAHGRAETLAQVGELEQVPMRQIEYHGIHLTEMDVDGVIARRPQWVLVDELAHSNVPGARRHKRYEDVLDLLDAGISVMTAVNIQHLETLNDAVAKSSNTRIRETVPDSFLKRADEVVNVDVTVDELRSRIKAGKVYPAEKIEQALGNFFRKGNLSLLRELSLRTVAEEVGAQAAQYRRIQGLEHAPLPEKVMVCLSSRIGTERLLRTGARIAGRLNSEWYAVLVESEKDDERRRDPEAAVRLENSKKLAQDLGAKLVVLKDDKVADALVNFAQREAISHVIFGQSARSRWDVLLRGSVINRFLSEVKDATVQVVPMGRKRDERK